MNFRWAEQGRFDFVYRSYLCLFFIMLASVGDCWL